MALLFQRRVLERQRQFRGSCVLHYLLLEFRRAFNLDGGAETAHGKIKGEFQCLLCNNLRYLDGVAIVPYARCSRAVDEGAAFGDALWHHARRWSLPPWFCR